MAGTTLNLDDVLLPDSLGCAISEMYIQWDIYRQEKKRDWDESRRYIFATDTTDTTNAKLPWKNKTTVPKLCQIRDNLYANYMLALFPKQKSVTFEAKTEADLPKKEACLDFINYVLAQPRYKEEAAKCVLDYIDYGNAFATVEWIDETQELEDRTKVGYVGPMIQRISPLDIVFNPIAPSFERSPKIIRSMISLGEVKEMLERESTDENREEYEDLFRYLKDIRSNSDQFAGDLTDKDAYLQVDGYSGFRDYLDGDYCEMLTFYGDIYDREKDVFYKNHVIQVVDRHKVIVNKPNPSFFGYPPIFHVGWRKRQDNLWAMGPLENLVGMQYRIDHVENLKADIFDLTAYPPLIVTGNVPDFDWGPFVKIFVPTDGKVEIMSPDVNALQSNLEIDRLELQMEEMSGSPREAMGFRTPGEKTKYEVQRLENAGSRIFSNKTVQMDESFFEKIINAHLDMARRNYNSAVEIRVFDNELKFTAFQTLTPEDIAGSGTVKPMGARHFAEKADVVQNLSNFYASGVAQDPTVMVHFSGKALAKAFENILEIEDYKIVIPYIRIAEQAEATRLSQTAEEQVLMESQTPSGMSPDDYDEGIA